MLIDDLILIMKADPSLNAYATGGIKYEHLPIDFDGNKDWIIFSYTKTGTVDTLCLNDVITELNLNVQVISKTLSNTEKMADRLTKYLINVTSNNFNSIILSDDDVNINSEKDIYYRTLDYGVNYNN